MNCPPYSNIEPGWCGGPVCCNDATSDYEYIEFNIPQDVTFITIPFQLPKLDARALPIGEFIENLIDDTQVVPTFNIVGKSQYSIDLLLSAPVDSPHYFYKAYWGNLGATPCERPVIIGALEYVEYNIPAGQFVITVPFGIAKVPAALVPVGVFIENVTNDPQVVPAFNIIDKQPFSVTLLLSAPVDSGNYWLKGNWSNVPLI